MTGLGRARTLALCLVFMVAAGKAVTLFAGGNREDPETRAPVSTASDGAAAVSPDLPPEFQGQSPPGSAGRQFTTDFSRAAISYQDILSGGPPKDGIPSIDEPRFDTLAEAAEWIGDDEPVLVITHGDETHLYPIQILTWHEIVNDEVGGLPVSVTFCPLCNTGIAFDRRFDGQILDFGTTGRLRFSNLIMYDRQTETWWQQASGRGLAGRYAGERLKFVPVLMVSFAEAIDGWPDARVVNRDTGHSRSYGRNPYVGYDSSPEPFLFRGPAINGNLDMLDRVVAVEIGDTTESVAYDVLQRERLVEREIGGERVYFIWEPGTASALDGPTITGSDDVGSANAFLARTTSGDPVELYLVGDEVRDRETGTTWNSAGRGVNGSRKDQFLEPAGSVHHFWFSYASFARP